MVWGVWGLVFFPFFLCICIPGSPGKFIYLLREKEGEAGQGAKPKNQSSTTYCKETERHPEPRWRRSDFSQRPPRAPPHDPGRAPGDRRAITPPDPQRSAASAGAAPTPCGSNCEPRRLLEDSRTYLIKNENTTARSPKHLLSPWYSCLSPTSGGSPRNTCQQHRWVTNT